MKGCQRINYPRPIKKLNRYDPWSSETFDIVRWMQTQYIFVPIKLMPPVGSVGALLLPRHFWFFNGRAWNLYRRVNVGPVHGHCWERNSLKGYMGAYVPVFEDGFIFDH